MNWSCAFSVSFCRIEALQKWQVLLCQYCWQRRQGSVMLIVQGTHPSGSERWLLKPGGSSLSWSLFASNWFFNLSERFPLTSQPGCVCVCVVLLLNSKGNTNKSFLKKWPLKFQQAVFISVVWIQFSLCTSEPAIIPVAFSRLLHTHRPRL